MRLEGQVIGAIRTTSGEVFAGFKVLKLESEHVVLEGSDELNGTEGKLYLRVSSVESIWMAKPDEEVDNAHEHDF
jgi:hypothetical protein